MAAILQTRREDSNLDSNVDHSDLEYLLAKLGIVDALWSKGNFDGDVDFREFNLLASELGAKP